MRRPGVGDGRRLGGGRVPFGARTPLMDWSQGGTFTRALAATVRPSDQTVLDYATGTRRIERGRFLSEISTVYTSRYSSDLTNAIWVKTNCTISADAVTAPDGTLTADAVVTTTGGVVTTLAQTTATAPAGNTTCTFWIRGDSDYTASYTFAGTGSASFDVNITTTWKQVVVRINSTVVPTITIRPHSGAGTGTAGRTMYVWGLNINNTTVAPSTITLAGANVTKPADNLSYAAGSWNTALAGSANFSMEWCPNTDSTGLNAVVDLLSFGGASDRLSVSNVDSVQVVVGGVIFLATGVFTYSRDQVLTFTFRPAAGSVTVAGATTGNGTYTGTPWTFPTAVTLRVGGRFGSTAEACGGVGNPYPA